MVDTTVRAVYDKAIMLIDEQDDASGETFNYDTQDFKVRTIDLLNHVLDEVYPASTTYYLENNGVRPALEDIESFDDELFLDPYICRTVLPYYLAWHFLLNLDPDRAHEFRDDYYRTLNEARAGLPAEMESMIDYYDGGIEYGWFSRWGWGEY